MSEPSCSICLEQLRTPVSIPCGHLHCSVCLTEHIENNANSFKSNCPTCRAPFSIVGPDIQLIPKKYHAFILPSVRRVYFDVSPYTDYKKRVKNLEARIASLERDKVLLMEKCEVSIARSQMCAVGERKALERAESARKESEKMKERYEAMKVKYEETKQQSGSIEWDIDTPPRLRIKRSIRPLPKGRRSSVRMAGASGPEMEMEWRGAGQAEKVVLKLL